MSGEPVKYEGKVRARDPGTSWEAAGQQTERRADRVREGILDVLAQGPATDEELVERYEAEASRRPTAVPRVTPQNIRTRRHDLLLAGRVVDTGRRKRTRSGSTAAVWRAAA